MTHIYSIALTSEHATENATKNAGKNGCENGDENEGKNSDYIYVLTHDFDYMNNHKECFDPTRDLPHHKITYQNFLAKNSLSQNVKIIDNFVGLERNAYYRLVLENIGPINMLVDPKQAKRATYYATPIAYENYLDGTIAFYLDLLKKSTCLQLVPKIISLENVRKCEKL